MNAICTFCGWEGDDDVAFCPKCREYKGLLRWRDRMNDTDLDARIEAYWAEHPDEAAMEP